MDLLVRHLVSILALLLLLNWNSILILHKSLSSRWFYLHRAVVGHASPAASAFVAAYTCSAGSSAAAPLESSHAVTSAEQPAVAASASAGTAPPSSAASPLALPVGSIAAPSALAPSSAALAEAAQLVQE